MYYIRGGSLTKAFNIISVRIGFFNDAIPLPSPYPLPFFLLSFLPFENVSKRTANLSVLSKNRRLEKNLASKFFSKDFRTYFFGNND